MTKQNGCPTGRARLEAAAAWVAGHTAELVALGLPVALALTTSIWLWAVAAVIGAAWIAHEIRQYRRRAAFRAQLAQRQLTTRQPDQDETAPSTQDSPHSESRHA